MGTLDTVSTYISKMHIFIFDEIETGSAANTLAAGTSCIVYGGSPSYCRSGCSKGRATEAVAKAGMGLAPVVAVMSPGMSFAVYPMESSDSCGGRHDFHWYGGGRGIDKGANGDR